MASRKLHQLIRLALAALLPFLTVPAAFPVETETPDNAPVSQNFHRWGSITLFNGLPSDSVRAIAQTVDGVLWFGTDNGLARFDGRRIQNFTLGDADSNRILALKTSDTGDLWIGTQNGAYVYFQNRFQPVGGTEGLPITAILLGRVAFLATSGAVLRAASAPDGSIAAERLVPETINGPDGKPLWITSLAINGDLLAIGTIGRGILEFSDSHFDELLFPGRPMFVNALAPDGEDALWIGADAKKGESGIYHLKTGLGVERLKAPTAAVSALENDKLGLWAGTARYGLFNSHSASPLESYTFANTSGGVRSDTVFSIFTDREGIVWIGTNRGVSRYDPQGVFQQTVSDVPNSNFIRTFSQSGDGSLLFAGSNRGLFSFDGDLWKPDRAFADRVIYAIGRNDDGPIVGTPSGTFDRKGKLLSEGDTRSFDQFRGRTYAAVFGRGVVDLTSETQPLAFGDPTVSTILAGHDRLWIGTAGHGLFSFDGQTVRAEAPPDNLKSGMIWRIFEGADRSIWLAAEHGVFFFKDGRAEQVVAGEDVRDVYVNGPDVWAATTSRGLLHARHDDRFGWLASAIGFEQGLPSEKAFAILPMNDRLLIATNRGVVSYFPHAMPPKLIPIRVLSQKLHDLSELTSTIALDYPQNSLLIEVAGQSSRTFPEEFQYSFTLKNWRGEVADNRFAREPQYAPADLAPGDYTVEAIAFDRDLNASEPLSIRFSIAKAPFPWTATALGVLLAIALVGLIWAVVEHRRIRQRNRELAAARFDLASEAERERSRIARDLHDQTLADLRDLMMKSDRLSPPNAEFRAEIESVSTEIRRICEDLSPSVLENVGLVAALEFLLTRSIEDHAFSTSEDANERVLFPVIVQLHIYRIAQEILTNLIRHSDATRVEMSVEISDDESFLLRIRDNGSSFKPVRKSKNARGIANIRSRASLIGATIAWEPSPASGNIFSLELAGKGSA